MSKLRGKIKPVSTTVNGKNNNLDIACAFSDHYNDLFNCVNYNIEDMDNLYEEVCKGAFSDHYNDLFNCVNYNIEDIYNLYEEVCKDSLYCSDHKHVITLSDIDNAMK